MASKIAEDSPTWQNIACNRPPRGFKIPPRRLQEAKRPPNDALGEANKGPETISDLCFCLPHRFFASEASRWLRDGPRDPREGSKRGPRRPQERPGPPQE
eukprot:9480480-Pyramimonas_sp.AAC.1